jgi:hypothetical protein
LKTRKKALSKKLIDRNSSRSRSNQSSNNTQVNAIEHVKERGKIQRSSVSVIDSLVAIRADMDECNTAQDDKDRININDKIAAHSRNSKCLCCLFLLLLAATVYWGWHYARNHSNVFTPPTGFNTYIPSTTTYTELVISGTSLTWNGTELTHSKLFFR